MSDTTDVTIGLDGHPTPDAIQAVEAIPGVTSVIVADGIASMTIGATPAVADEAEPMALTPMRLAGIKQRMSDILSGREEVQPVKDKTMSGDPKP